MCIRDRAYIKIGGHEKIKGLVLDDFELARSIKTFGFSASVLDGTSIVETNGYKSSIEAVDGEIQNIDEIFDLLEPQKLSMVEDKPWSWRRGHVWHNSGVVGFILSTEYPQNGSEAHIPSSKLATTLNAVIPSEVALESITVET